MGRNLEDEKGEECFYEEKWEGSGLGDKGKEGVW